MSFANCSGSHAKSTGTAHLDSIDEGPELGRELASRPILNLESGRPRHAVSCNTVRLLAVGLQALAMAAAAALAAGLLHGRPALATAAVRRGLGFGEIPRELWLLAVAYAPLTMVMFQAFAGLAEVFDDADYRSMVLVNAVALVAFPPLLWSLVSRVEGALALTVGGLLQGAGIVCAAVSAEPVLTTIVWSAGEATLIAVVPAVIAGIAPHRATGRCRAAFATVQGAAAALATCAGPLLARSSTSAFAAAALALTALGVLAILARARSIGAALRQPVACPCGALLCSCDVSHLACVPSPVLVHEAAPAGGAVPPR